MQYQGRELNLSPVNITLAQIVALLDARRPVRVELQPGDATRYEFLIVPLVGQLSGTGHYSDGCLAHVPVNLRTDGRFTAFDLDFEVGPYDLETYQNEHTRNVLAHFYLALRQEMGRIANVAVRQVADEPNPKEG